MTVLTPPLIVAALSALALSLLLAAGLVGALARSLDERRTRWRRR